MDKIRHAAKIDAKKRKDRRYLDTMSLLVSKGLLRTNMKILPRPNSRISLDDAVWAGINVEPRILEVLPAAVLRLGRHFVFLPERHAGLLEVVACLRLGAVTGPDFMGISYKKLRIWADFPLKDGRVKTVSEKKIMRAYRLRPEIFRKLENMAKQRGCTETEVIENVIRFSFSARL